MTPVLLVLGIQTSGRCSLLEALQPGTHQRGTLELTEGKPIEVIELPNDGQLHAEEGVLAADAVLLEAHSGPDARFDLARSLGIPVLVAVVSEDEDVVAAWAEHGVTVEVFPVSTGSAKSLEPLRAALSDQCRATTTHLPPWLIAVERSFVLKDQGLVASGIVRGRGLAAGANARVEPGGQGAHVRGIRSHGRSVVRATQGQRVTVDLEGVDERSDLSGKLLTEDPRVVTALAIEGEVDWIHAPKHGSRVRVALHTQEAIGKLFLNHEHPKLAQVRFDQPVATRAGEKFVIVRYSPSQVLGGGRVTNPQVAVRKSRANVSSEQLPEAIYHLIASRPDGATTSDICNSVNKSAQQLGEVFETLLEQGKIASFAGLWFTEATFAESSGRFLETLRAAHSRYPSQTGIARERIAHLAKLNWAGKPLDRILSFLASEKKVIVHGTSIRHPEFRPALPARQRQLLDRVLTELRKEPVNVPISHDIARSLVVPHQAILEILKVGVKAGEVVEVAEGLFYTRDQIEAIQSRLIEIAGGRKVSAATVRDRLGTSRRYVIPLLEYLDSVHFTTRMGDQRVVNGRI